MKNIKLWLLAFGIVFSLIACEQQSSDKDRLTIPELEQKALFLNDFVSYNYNIGDSVWFVSEAGEDKYFVVQNVGQGVVIIDGGLELEDENDRYKEDNPYYNKTIFYQSYVYLKNEVSLDNFTLFLTMDDFEKISWSVDYIKNNQKFKLDIIENVNLIQISLDTECFFELKRNVGITKMTDKNGHKWILKEHKKYIVE